MTDDALRERVARALRAAAINEAKLNSSAPATWEELADAALAAARPVIRAQALEEAAKVCEGLEPPEGNTYTYGMYWEDGAGACADAIRALKEKT